MNSLIFSNASSSSNAAVSYLAPGILGYASQAAEADVGLSVVSAPGSIDGMRVLLKTAPGAGNSWTVTLRKNGSDTAQAVTISETDVSGSSSTAVAVSAGDYLSYSITPASTPTAHGGMGITHLFGSTTDLESNMLGGSRFSDMSTTSTEYYSPQNMDPSATESTRRGVCGTTGTFRDLFVRLEVAPGVGTSRTFTVMKNGVNTALTVTISDAATTGSDTSNTFTVAAGDEISIEATISGTPSASRVGYGATFVADNAGESVIMSPPASNPNDTVTNYSIVNGGRFDGTETNVQNSGYACTLSDFYVKLASAPGVGNSLAFDVRVNGASPADDLAVTVSGTDTSGSDVTNTVAVADGDSLGIRCVPTSTPTVGGVRMGLVATFAAPTDIATVDGLAYSSVATVNGLARASIGTINGLA